MALPAAMVLSGLPKDQFTGNLHTVFTQGSVLLKSPRSALQSQASARPTTFSSSAGFSLMVRSSAVASSSSAPSTMAPSASAASTSVLSTPAPSTSALSTSAASSMSAASSASTPTPSPALSPDSSPLDSGIASSISSTDTEKSLKYYLRVINKIEQKFQHMHEYPNSERDDSNITVMFEGRNVLNLGANVRSSWPLQYATLPSGVDHFFENRSQLSRVAGAELPLHTNHGCEDPECGFIEPVYH